LQMKATLPLYTSIATYPATWRPIPQNLALSSQTAIFTSNLAMAQF
jgi:hypothetical protein